MDELDRLITKAYFGHKEAQGQRIRFQSLLHPETLKGKTNAFKRSDTTFTRIEAYADLGFGEEFYQRMIRAEKDKEDEMMALAATHPLAEHFEQLERLGPRMWFCGAFIAASGDITRTPTVTAYWKGMGLDIIQVECPECKGEKTVGSGPARRRIQVPCEKCMGRDGESQGYVMMVPRKVPGKKDTDRKIPALKHVTTIGELIRTQINLSKGPLKRLYIVHRAKYDARYPDRPKTFNHRAALRIAQKVFYSCLWREWRLARGLPAPDPEAFEILGHPKEHMIHISDLYKDSTREFHTVPG